MTLENADYGGAGESITYGNLTGRELLEEKHDQKERLKRVEDKLEKTNEELAKTNEVVANSKIQIADLQHRVKTLTLASEGYRKIRHRFLEVYRRDILEDVNRQGRKKIGDGNEAAHSGDAIADANLYASGERHDEKVLIALYGLT